MKNKTKLFYYIVTGLFTLMILGGAGQYIFMHDMAAEAFTLLGFPTYLIYPMAAAKLLGIVAIWSNISPTLKEWAYAGFTFNLLLAVSAHINVSDGEFIGAVMGLILMSGSYILGKKVEAQAAAEA